ncbi:hypothetical protein Q0M94_21700 (plasmid) [Deinococcus radiomollis]|uniref:hypothetical protein n=1 Tax=Deinococcus radiomollis TaxID=468916 RepID=UPI003892CBC0
MTNVKLTVALPREALNVSVVNARDLTHLRHLTNTPFRSGQIRQSQQRKQQTRLTTGDGERHEVAEQQREKSKHTCAGEQEERTRTRGGVVRRTAAQDRLINPCLAGTTGQYCTSAIHWVVLQDSVE